MRSRSLTVGGIAATALGLFSFDDVRDGAASAGGAVTDNWLGAVAVLVGLATLAWTYRDALLHRLGMTTRSYVKNRVRQWLSEQGFTATPLNNFPDFAFEGRDAWQFAFVVAWRATPPRGIEIKSGVRLAAHHVPIMQRATREQIRAVHLDIVKSCLGPALLDATFVDLDNPPTLHIEFISVLSADDFEFRPFFEHIYYVRRAVMTAGLIITALVEAIIEGDTPAQMPT